MIKIERAGPQLPLPDPGVRKLGKEERTALIANGNRAEKWENLSVSGRFDPSLVWNCRFAGIVTIGNLEEAWLVEDGRRVATGIYNCRLTDCEIGDNSALYDIGCCEGYRIGAGSILQRIDEMRTGAAPSFGTGAACGIDLINEGGGRRIHPFVGILPADALLMARYRDDTALLAAIDGRGEQEPDAPEAFLGGPGEHPLGKVGAGTIIRSCRIIEDVAFGPGCRVVGADRLTELTIQSSPEEPTVIGAGVQLEKGIVGYGCSVIRGAVASRFVLGNNAAIEYGARLIDSVLGDNSIVAGAEVRHSLIFPGHAQHHTNSFLIAALIQGQSNIAAGATIGSNHNSRAADNELIAGRGFWPGLSVSLKYPSRFASFTLIAKGNYPFEIDLPLPFSLVNTNATLNRLEIMPGFWWNYNMYALVRNAKKYAARDKRIRPGQQVEYDFLAPDTAAEMYRALTLLNEWDSGGEADSLEAPRGLVERSSRTVCILKAAMARQAYREMLTYYIAITLLPALEERGPAMIDELADAPEAIAPGQWINMGGQLVPEVRVDRLREEIRRGALGDFQAIHRRYHEWTSAYGADRERDAFVYFHLLERGLPDAAGWRRLFAEAERIQKLIEERVRESRSKDLEDTFKALSFRNDAERAAVQGTIDANEFVRSIRKESAALIERFRTAGQLL